MKKLITFILFLAATNIAFSDTIIFNMSEKNIMQINYRICDVDMKTKEKKCDDSYKKLEINTTNKNYFIFKPSIKNLLPMHYERLEIISVMAKNTVGTLIAESNYIKKDNAEDTSCNAMISTSYKNDEQFITETMILNDMKQSPFILCTVNAGTVGFLNLA